MSADQVFAFSNSLALLGWLALAIGARWRPMARLVTAVIIPSIFGFAYLYILLVFWGNAEGGFGSLAEVAKLFENPNMLLAGWLHYLGFDLFVGSWEVRDSQLHGISIWLVIPCMFFTFMFGPVGLLAYMAIRGGLRRKLEIGEPQHA